MPPVFVPAILVVDPSTGLPLIEARGAVGTIYAEGTSTPLTLTQDKAGNIAIPQPITITPGGYIPAHWNQEGLRGTFRSLSETWSTPVWSPQGLEESAAAASAAAAAASDSARVSAQAAQNAAALVGAPTDETVAGLLGSVSQSRAAVVDLIGSTAVVDPTPWPDIPQKPAEGTLLGEDIEVDEDVETGTITLRPTGRLSQAALDAVYVAATVLTGDGIDPTGTTDSTTAVQAAFDSAAAFGVPEVHVPAGTYVLDTISLTADVTVRCAPGVVFRRAAGADTQQGNYWVAGAAMFEVDAPGVSVEFTGGPTFDGNNTAQPTIEPTGFAIKLYPTATIADRPTRLRVEGARFINGTSGYLCLRGDDAQRRYETIVDLDRCTFEDTVYGKASGDPSTPTPLGYHPTYVHVYDYVTLRTRDLRATFDKPVGSGNYAPCAVNGTFYGQDSATSGEASVFLHGTTYLRGVGRSGRAYNDDTAYNVSNGIGAVDMYGNVEELYVEHVVAVDCDNVPVRAKASVRRVTIDSAVLINCHRGISVEPSSTGEAETTVRIGDVVSYGGSVPQLEVIGNTTSNRIPTATVESFTAYGPMTDPETYNTGGALHFRNIANLDARGLEVHGAPFRGITFTDVDVAEVHGVIVDGAAQQGVLFTGCGRINISDFDVQNTGGEGVMSMGNPALLSVAHGRTRNTVNYGVFSNNQTTHLTVEDVSVETVGGASRGFYAGGGDAAFIRNKSGAGVTSPLVTHANTTKREDHNSWNPTESWGFGAPTEGTYVRGSKVWLLNPVAGGTVGHICTADGTPGTWKPFGAITA